jgi:hypothetical protein
VLPQLSLARSTAHAKVFQGTAKTCQFMAFEMCHADYPICCNNFSPNVRFRKMFFINLYAPVGIPSDAISNNDRRAYGCIAEPVFNCQAQVRNSIAALTPVEGVGISEKRISFAGSNFLHNIPYENGAYKCSIPLFTKMQFNRYQLFFLYNGGYGNLIKQPVELSGQIFFYVCSKVYKKNTAFHTGPDCFTQYCQKITTVFMMQGITLKP